ncbi:hypothetical protein EDM76_12770 [bacterium]|nr:MAG: hypothetical protein EDM76_12770 [bacterium]
MGELYPLHFDPGIDGEVALFDCLDRPLQGREHGLAKVFDARLHDASSAPDLDGDVDGHGESEHYGACT